MKSTQCPLCDEEIVRAFGTRHRMPHSCLAVGVVPPAKCWRNDTNPLLVHCAQSQRLRRRRSACRLDMDATLRSLGHAIRNGEQDVRALLQGLAPEARHELLHSVVPPLATFLSSVLADMPGAIVRRARRSPVYPEDLPVGLREPLERFENKLVRKYETRLRNNHSPSIDYVWRTMLAPIRFAQFLQAKGIERWDIVRKRDVVAFLQENTGTASNHVMRFMRFLEDHKPWRDPRGRPSGKGRKAKSLMPPTIVLPDELEAILSDIERSRTDAEFLLAWFVCRMGLTLETAYSLPLESVRMNDAGRLVVRPADVWVTVPRLIAQRLDAVIETAIPGWKALDPQASQHLTFFRHHIQNPKLFGRVVLGGRTRVLRTSALFAAMMKGHTDRVTLRHTTGASIPYLTKIETLLSIDMHRRLAPDLVEKRNAYITGDADE